MKNYYQTFIALSISTLIIAAPTWATANTGATLPVTQTSIQLDEETKRVVEKTKMVMPILRDFIVKDIWKGKQFSRIRFTKPQSTLTATLYFHWQTGEVFGCSITDSSPITIKNTLSDQEALQKSRDFLQKVKAITNIDLTQAKQERIERGFANLITISFPSAKLENTDYIRLDIDHKGQVIHFQKAGFKLIDELSIADFDEVAKKSFEKASSILPGFKNASVDYVMKGLIEYDPVDTWKVQSSIDSGDEKKTIYMIEFDSRTGEIYQAYQGINPTDSAIGITTVQAIAEGKKLLEKLYGEEAKSYTVKQIEQDTQNKNPNKAYTVVVFEAPSLKKKVTIQLYKDGQLLSLEKKIPLP
jgi:hypothetical protein